MQRGIYSQNVTWKAEEDNGGIKKWNSVEKTWGRAHAMGWSDCGSQVQ
jgi:hypothetical protein